jgi:hypothetical protein
MLEAEHQAPTGGDGTAMARRAQNLQTRMCSDMHAYAHGDTVLQAVLHEHIRTAHAWSDPGAAQQI